MKIKYRISDGAILAAGHMKDIPAGPGEAVEEFDGDLPANLADFKRADAGKLQEKTKEEKEITEKEQKRFTPESFVKKFEAIPDVQSQLAFLAKAVSKIAGNLKESEV